MFQHHQATWLRKILGQAAGLAACVGSAMATPSASASPAPVDLTLLHTNDLHSHFRPEKTPLSLGGVARLKTELRRVRASVPHSLLVDGGDWSEGNVYYLAGAGRETLRMMDHLGYDVAVVGNHDWLNGVDMLLGAVEAANPSMQLVATNVRTEAFDRESAFRGRIPPYVIRDVGGAKVAFIGLLTYEFIYDRFMRPVKITEPFAITRELARKLKNSADPKKRADAVIVISHNSIKTNQAVLQAAPDVDLVVGAHDHVKLTREVRVPRLGAKPGWIVETGSWGRYLGRVDLRITPRDLSDPSSQSSVELKEYHLTQIDSRIPEDPETLSRIATLEAQIEAGHGPIFHDHVGDSEVELSHAGMENLMGDFTTDAFRQATGADLAIDHSNFIYGDIHAGAVRTVDVFNSNPGIYDPRTGKAWTLSLLPIRGRTLSYLFNAMYSLKAFSQGGSLNFSGVEMIFSPLFLNASDASPGEIQLPGAHLELFAEPTTLAPPDPSAASTGGISIRSFKIQGEELDPDRTYRLAAPGGVIQAVEFLNSLIPGAVPLERRVDTGLEDWRIMLDHLRAITPVTLDKLDFGRRVRTTKADLGILADELRWEPSFLPDGRAVARIRLRVRNAGTLASQAGSAGYGPRVRLLLNRHGADLAVDPEYFDAAEGRALPALPPGESVELTWEGVEIPLTAQGVYPLTAQVSDSTDELNRTNDQVTRYFSARAPRRTPLRTQAR